MSAVHRWYTGGGTQVVHRWYTGGTQVVHRYSNTRREVGLASTERCQELCVSLVIPSTSGWRGRQLIRCNTHSELTLFLSIVLVLLISSMSLFFFGVIRLNDRKMSTYSF